jgi:tRNA U34 5-methylaminomethyl-2-thiouridine-forming methyltransferase MnmC
MSSIEHHISKDGSSTLFSKEFDQFYHNPNGALSESRHVFFEQSGFIEFLKNTKESISIFEMGFGTGLNFLLLMEYLKSFDIQIPIHFYSVEAFPAESKVVRQFNYLDQLDIDLTMDQLANVFMDLKSGINEIIIPQAQNVKLSMFAGYFDDMPNLDSKIDFFFHDPFSPEVNPELWSVKTFDRLKGIAKDDAVLSTYCAASKARAAIAKAGWFVAKATGALGKREMTVASLNEKKLRHLKRVNELRLIQRFDTGDFDN